MRFICPMMSSAVKLAMRASTSASHWSVATAVRPSRLRAANAAGAIHDVHIAQAWKKGGLVQDSSK